MRHNKHHASLGLTTEHRKAMLSNMGASLIRHGRIKTTLTKAKALRPFIEKIITKAKKAAALAPIDGKIHPGALHLIRVARRKLRDRDALHLLFNEKAAQFANRPGGYTRIYKLGPQRLGDAAEMALIELIAADDPGYPKRRRKKSDAKKPAGKPGAEAAPSAEAATTAEAATPADGAPAAPQT